LRQIVDLDGDRLSPFTEAAVDIGPLLTACAQKSTGADPVLGALAYAAADWVARGDVKRLRSALLGVIANLE
jgi:hypothetical protein